MTEIIKMQDIYKAGDHVYCFPDYLCDMMSEKNIVSCDAEKLSTGGLPYSLDFVRHTPMEAIIEMQRLRGLEIKRILDLQYTKTTQFVVL